ncbi:helix-turn-helix transcriptional regulator [Pseudonocardia adelaidensis]|uniref:HTH luxR-type domain-containing protein n=1 Tax=Pseudonocardia adelaidensis TaxID=648754 RepID=A0ABP9NGE1_9PSEU
MQPQRRDAAWLDLVADLVAAPLTKWPHDEVARLLVETFNAPAACFYSDTVQEGVEQRGWPPEHFAGHLEEALYWGEHYAPTEHPILRYYRATGDIRCMQVVDVPTEIAERRVLAAWTERGRRWGGVQAQLSFPVLFSPSARRSFIVGRGDLYSPAEMRLAHQLQRLLTGLDRQISAFSCWAERNGPPAEVVTSLHLTPRELAVLDLAAHGLTAAAIGRRLTIAERTVLKHLEHIYSKLGVGNRLAAVQRAQRVGLLSPP